MSENMPSDWHPSERFGSPFYEREIEPGAFESPDAIEVMLRITVKSVVTRCNAESDIAVGMIKGQMFRELRGAVDRALYEATHDAIGVPQ